MPTLATVRASNATWDPSYTPVGVFVGGTSGIGEGIAEAFARHTRGSAHIILIGRNRPAATAILARIEKPPVLGLTREFLPCDLTLIANAKRAAAALRPRFPHIDFLFLSAGTVSPKGLDIGEEGVDRQMAALYCSKWAFIDELLPALLIAGRGRSVDLDDLGLLASYRDLMAEVFAAHDANTGISFTHAFPGTVDAPLRRASPSAILRAVHYLRFLLFPTLMFRAMTISECGEYQLYGLLQHPPAPPAQVVRAKTSGWAARRTRRGTRRWSNTAALQQLLRLVLPSYSIPTPMPLFTSASGVQINGGNFIDIAGDVNLHSLQPAIAQNSDPLSATQSRRLLGVDRNTLNGGARLVSYDFEFFAELVWTDPPGRILVQLHGIYPIGFESSTIHILTTGIFLILQAWAR
ncbi:hypothetical protein B0H13DRAFT_2321804 [Mycena leptocephala]|nr:hypothetical protein B0H13DRAFT_2321804 [Mycena leptocephala]